MAVSSPRFGISSSASDNMLSLVLLKALAKAMDFRFDGVPALCYFDEKDFNICAEPFSFRSGKWLLRGKKYYLPNIEHKALITFFHGAGAGHSAYMLEIAALVQQGYLVYAYDNTGCMTSEGTGIGSFAQSLLDQKAFYAFLDKKDTKGLARYAIGHSWGGFTALGALDPAYHVEKVVSISGFLSVKAELIAQLPILEKFEGTLDHALRKGYGEFGLRNMIDLIRQSSAKVLYIQGENDPVVPRNVAYDLLEQHFKDDPRVCLLLVPGAMHNPYWTLEAQKYFLDLQAQSKILRLDFDNHARVDYQRLNADDPKVMGPIIKFLSE